MCQQLRIRTKVYPVYLSYIGKQLTSLNQDLINDLQIFNIEFSN